MEALEERQLVVDVEDGVPAVDDVEGALLKGALGSVSHLKGHLEGRGQLGLVRGHPGLGRRGSGARSSGGRAG